MTNQNRQATPEAALFELRGVTKTFRRGVTAKKVYAVNSLDCSFLKGACTGLLGHNGAGKTTVIRSILGLIRPSAGSILFEGRSFQLADRNRIGYMPEVDKLALALTPWETLEFHLRLFRRPGNDHLLGTRQKRRERIEEMLTRTGLISHRKKLAGHLSKGMRRRLAWAQAVIHDPDVVILDEPFSGLDPLGRRQMLEWVLDLKKAQKTLILCTHELWTMRELCDHFHILNHGRLAYSSAIQEPQNGTQPDSSPVPFTLKISGASQDVVTKIQAGFNLPHWVSIKQDGLLLTLQFSRHPDAARWLSTAVEKGFVIVSFNDTAPFAGEVDDAGILRFFDGGDQC